MSPEDRDRTAAELRTAVLAVLPDLPPGAVAAYASVGTEPGTRDLLAALVHGQRTVLLPLLLPDGDLDWAAYDGELRPGPRGLLQPAGPPLGPGAVAACALVVVPALAVDRSGTRLGRGGGSYDRALARAAGPAVAALHRGELVDRLPCRAPRLAGARGAGARRGPGAPARAPGLPRRGGAWWDGAVTPGFDDLLSANRDYAARFTDAGLKGRAARGLAVVTCMDSRIEPLQMLGLSQGDAKILRNAGARVTDDVLRTLVLAVHLLGVDRIMVVAHTDCRMATVTDEQVHEAIRDSAGLDTRSLEFRTMDDQEATLADDVQKIRSSPYLPAQLPVVGCRYDVSTGQLEVVVPAS